MNKIEIDFEVIKSLSWMMMMIIMIMIKMITIMIKIMTMRKGLI